MLTRWQRPAALLLAALSGVGLLSAGWQWQSARATQSAILELASGRDIGAERRFAANLPVRLAHALLVGRREQYADAQELLADLANRGDSRFRARTEYDLGNLYLRQALAAAERGEASRAAPLADLAKEAYRGALRHDPTFGDAKFNLETASRLLPDFEPVDNGTEQPDEEAARKLWTRVPGFPRGLP